MGVNFTGFYSYHIGVKLQPQVDLNEIKKILQDFAAVNGYEINRSDETNRFTGFLSIDISTGVEKIASKEGVDLKVHIPLKAINLVGRDPHKVGIAFRQVVEYLQSEGRYELDANFDFYEVVAECGFANSRTPAEILNSNTDLNLVALSEIAGNAEISGLHIKSKGKLPDPLGGLDIILEPHPNRPSKELNAKVIWQTKDIERVESFYNELKEAMQRLFNEN